MIEKVYRGSWSAMKIIEALEEALKNESRLGDKSFDLSHEQLNDFFYYQAETPLTFPNCEPSLDDEHTIEEAPAEVKAKPSVKAHSVPPVLQEKLEVKAPQEAPIRKLTIKKEAEEAQVETEIEEKIDLSAVPLDDLRSKALSCTKCLLSFNDPAETNQAKVMFVLDASLIKGDLQDPFAGPAGDFFKKILSAMKLDMKDVYIANIHRCPRSSDLKEQSAAILQQMKLIKPQACVVCSPSIIRAISEYESINQCRGKWINWDGLKIMPSYSPAFLMRSENVYGKVKKKEAWSDLQLVMKELT